MKEQKLIRNELLKNMAFNLILFSIIFTAFSIMILSQVSRYLYTSVDNEIYQVRKQIQEMPEIIVTVPSSQNIIGQDEEDESQEALMELLQVNIEEVSNPRVITILRDEDGKVLSSSLSGKVFFKYLENLNFNTSNIDKIYELCVNSKYYYRGTTCKVNTSEGTYYIELIINVNSEKVMMTNFTNSLSVGTGIVIVISIFISYYLSKKSIDPIIRAYKNQAEFVQNASHELRTPLTIIQAKQEMLLQSPDSKIIDKSEDIALTLNETRRLSKMVTELMDLARADSNNITLNKTKTNLNDLVQTVVIPYQELAKLQNKILVVNAKCKKEVNLDVNKIKQLIVILLDNALKYTEENDTITVDVHNTDDKAFINVKDTGIGISDEALKHVFERFYREDKARSREKGGTGLGLSIAHMIVKKHGGTIKIVHNKPKGIIVIVKL